MVHCTWKIGADVTGALDISGASTIGEDAAVLVRALNVDRRVRATGAASSASCCCTVVLLFTHVMMLKELCLMASSKVVSLEMSNQATNEIVVRRRERKPISRAIAV